MEEKRKSSGMNKNLMWTGIAVLFVLILIMTMSFAVTPVIAQPVEVRVKAPEYVEEGGTFVATIDVDSVTDFSLAQFDLSFDPDVIEVSAVRDGEINGDTVPIYMDSPVNESTIRVIIMMLRGECVSGSGYLAEIKFDVSGDEGKESKLGISNEKLGNVSGGKIPAIWHDAVIRIGIEEEDEDEEEVGEEVIPGSPNIMAWNPVEAVVNNTEDESRAFNITVDQIAAICWQINGTEVQTNESTREAVFTNTSAVIGTWNVSAIATNTTTELSDMHTWIWSVTTTAITPTPTLAPGETPKPTPTPTLAPGETPKPTPTPTLAPRGTPTPTKPTATPKPAIPGSEAVFAIAVLLAIAYLLLRRR